MALGKALSFQSGTQGSSSQPHLLPSFFNPYHQTQQQQWNVNPHPCHYHHHYCLPSQFPLSLLSLRHVLYPLGSVKVNSPRAPESHNDSQAWVLFLSLSLLPSSFCLLATRLAGTSSSSSNITSKPKGSGTHYNVCTQTVEAKESGVQGHYLLYI